MPGPWPADRSGKQKGKSEHERKRGCIADNPKSGRVTRTGR